MSAYPCGCDPEAGHMCDGHRIGAFSKPSPLETTGGNMFVVGLGHKARHGKNYAAKAIIRDCFQRGLYAKEYAFADALKDVCRVQFGMTQKDPVLLQLAGTEIYRRNNPDVLTTALRWRLLDENPDVAIITDMRFPNEVEMVRDFGGRVMKVTRLLDGKLWVAGDRDPNHPSETALDTYTGWDEHLAVESGDTDSLNDGAIIAFRRMLRSFQDEQRSALESVNVMLEARR